MAEGSGDDRVGSVFTPFYRFRSQLELSTSTNHHVKLSRFACALLVLIGSEHQQKCEKKKKGICVGSPCSKQTNTHNPMMMSPRVRTGAWFIENSPIYFYLTLPLNVFISHQQTSSIIRQFTRIVSLIKFVCSG